MITKEQFIKLITLIQQIEKEQDRWDDFGINIYETSLSESIEDLTDFNIKLLFKESGVDWINWWLYERPAMFEWELDNKAYDENDNEIPTETIDDLWNIVKDYRK